jgi:hypothetical protein
MSKRPTVAREVDPGAGLIGAVLTVTLGRASTERPGRAQPVGR